MAGVIGTRETDGCPSGRGRRAASFSGLGRMKELTRLCSGTRMSSRVRAHPGAMEVV